MGRYYINVTEIRCVTAEGEPPTWQYADGILPFGDGISANLEYWQLQESDNDRESNKTITLDVNDVDDYFAEDFVIDPKPYTRFFTPFHISTPGYMDRLRKAFPGQRVFPDDAHYITKLIYNQYAAPGDPVDKEMSSGDPVWVTFRQLMDEKAKWEALIADAFVDEMPFEFMELYDSLMKRFNPEVWKIDPNDVRVIIWDNKWR